MPVADKRQDQNQDCDYQQASRFQRVNLRHRVVLTRWRVRLRLGPSSRHGSILVPDGSEKQNSKTQPSDCLPKSALIRVNPRLDFSMFLKYFEHQIEQLYQGNADGSVHRDF